MNQITKQSPRGRRRKPVPPPASHTLDQLFKDLDGLERLQTMQLRLIQEIRKQLTELTHNKPV